MKKLVIALTILFVFSISAYAQMSGMTGTTKNEMKQQDMMPMMQMCMPMMQQMMGQGMMMKDMMQMMMDMMQMQERMLKGMKAEKKMMQDMAQMKEKMKKMMSMNMGMMMGTGDPQAKLTCAEQWLKKAVDLHELHMKDPKTTTDASQIELMDQIKKAYECITGTGSEMGLTPPKKPEVGEKKKDEHGH